MLTRLLSAPCFTLLFTSGSHLPLTRPAPRDPRGSEEPRDTTFFTFGAPQGQLSPVELFATAHAWVSLLRLATPVSLAGGRAARAPLAGGRRARAAAQSPDTSSYGKRCGRH